MKLERNTEEIDWHRPCCHGCLVGRPKGMAPNGTCKHARVLHRAGGMGIDYVSDALKHLLKEVLRDRAAMAETIRRFQKNQEIESDYIDPFEPSI